MTAVTEDDVVLLRAGSGTIHLGIPLGRGYDTMCCQMIASPSIRTYVDEKAEAVLERAARFLCDECATVSQKPWRIIRLVTGW